MMRAAIMLAFWAAQGLGAATVTYTGRAGVAQPWLAIQDDPRSAALGGAVVAADSGPQALYANPAGLSLLYEPQIQFNHNEWSSELGLRGEALSGGRRWGEAGVALGLRFFSFGTFENRDSLGTLIDSSQDQAMAGALGYGASFFDEKFHLGATLQASQQALGASSSLAVLASAGALYEWTGTFKVAAALRGQGLSVEKGSAPAAMVAGFSWRPYVGPVTLLGQWERPDGLGSRYSAGLEWKLADFLVARGGYVGSGEAGDLYAGPSGGLSLRVGSLSLDYAYVPQGTLNQAHRMGLTLEISEGLFGGDIVIQGVNVSQTAQAEYADGMEAYKKGDWYTAKVALNRSVKLFPEFSKADQIKVTLAEIERKIAADRSKGLSPAAREKLKERVAEAQRLLKAGELGKARKEIETALEYDSSLKEALDMLSKINNALESKTSGAKSAAVEALAKGDIRTAALKYRSVLKVKDDDAEALSRLRKLAPRIRDEVKKLHREGIDAYVNREPGKAVEYWEQALELDPSDPRNIRRDLEKARKLQELISNK